MKKIIAIAAAASLFIASAMNINAKSKVQVEEEGVCYAWLTSCGIEICYEFPFDMGDDFLVEFMDVLEDIFCD